MFHGQISPVGRVGARNLTIHFDPIQVSYLGAIGGRIYVTRTSVPRTNVPLTIITLTVVFIRLATAKILLTSSLCGWWWIVVGGDVS